MTDIWSYISKLCTRLDAYYMKGYFKDCLEVVSVEAFLQAEIYISYYGTIGTLKNISRLNENFTTPLPF